MLPFPPLGPYALHSLRCSQSDLFSNLLLNILSCSLSQGLGRELSPAENGMSECLLNFPKDDTG